MATGLRIGNRSILTLHDLSVEELIGLIDLAGELKNKKAAKGRRGDLLCGKSIALLFEKMSTRTRCAASVAAFDEGGRAEYLSSSDLHLGKKESVADTARVLGRMFDGILYRGYSHERVECLARNAGIPVWNGLTDEAHPTQVLADLMTVRESFGRLQGVKLVYVGDGRNNVANSLMLGCAMVGMEYVNCTPVELAPRPALVANAEAVARKAGGSVAVNHVPMEAVAGANVLYTDVWVSMGEEAKFEERLAMLRPYQVNESLVDATGRADSEELIFLHCLPAFHDHDTDVSKNLGALEVTDGVFESRLSKVFDQAENRMHTTKAVFVAALAEQ